MRSRRAGQAARERQPSVLKAGARLGAQAELFAFRHVVGFCRRVPARASLRAPSPEKGGVMNIGEPKRVIEIEPVTVPVPETIPVPEPSPEPEPSLEPVPEPEPVPADR